MGMGMKRRRVLMAMAGGVAGAAVPVRAQGMAGEAAGDRSALPSGAEDRRYLLGLLERMATPVLSRMARGRLQQEWTPELSPTWDKRDPKVAYMEAFARLIDGIAPWLALPDTDDAEGRLRRTLREQAVQSYVHSVDPASPDRLGWEGHGQALVDSAYFTSALLRAPKTLWEPLDTKTKQRIVAVIKGLRRISPPYQNWLLFAAMNEAFLFSIGEDWDPMRVDMTVKLFAGDWYVGDGWYGDGERFHFDYYNSYVIHPMMVQVLEVLSRGNPSFNNLKPAEAFKQARHRMQRYGEHLERMIGPDGAYAAIGRSLTYRIAAHQVLGVLAWRGWLPETLPGPQVRAATVMAARRVFADPSNFNADGFLTIGFTRAQPTLGDWYSNAGSMYIASEGLVALGRPASDPFWTGAAMPWTMRRAYAGQDFRKDYPVDY
ncbi:hypothetical protein SAMN05216557_102619 [Sphingomonas carotinifaciens]|uniref:DUF2264 domain-containing protein n=3 Tax=Sphingomonas carotinifaciens TaxID=1166323 RepID=A0A1G7JFM3_9SPHN|nr:DUF2264 domain-containing protein [Sphingomonas carotinifaciens]MWC43898.1 DUF2264 domain-containing protein [Sphingomonas carotinifaciens]SDF23693.1 hypothetical protein SAMN05216557_102619 [Sphingomonas carotinifaciens]